MSTRILARKMRRDDLTLEQINETMRNYQEMWTCMLVPKLALKFHPILEYVTIIYILNLNSDSISLITFYPKKQNTFQHIQLQH